MLAFNSILETRKGKKYETSTDTNMSESNSSESDPIIGTRANDITDESEALTHSSSEGSRRADQKLHRTLD